MFEPFVVRATIAAVATALLAGPVGCLMIWRKTAYFGDTLSHAALAGIVAGAALGIAPNLAVALLVCALALLLVRIPQKTVLGVDLYLLIVGQTALCAGLAGLAYMPDFRADLTGYLFGDVLSVSDGDLLFTLIAGLPCALILIKNWKNQVFCAVAPDIAAGENISPQHQNRLFTVLIAVFVALSFKTTGLLLVSALTVIPACAARFISKTPEQMAVKASFIGVVCSVSGIALSVFANAPAAPAIELTCAFCFVLCGFWDFCHKNDI